MSTDTYCFSLTPVEVPPIRTQYRRIQGALPVPESLPLLATLLRYEPRSMTLDQLPVVWDRAEGSQVYDPYGNCWIDFTAGIFVANSGHGHPTIRAALHAMIDRPLLHNYYFPSEIRARLVEKLVQMAPDGLDTAFLLTTGSEATECAIKLTRIHGQTIHPRKLGIVSLALGFHGKTMGSQTAGGRPAAKNWIGQLDPNFHQIPVPGRAEDFHRGLAQLETDGVDLETIAGFLLEPYQGWSAAFLPDGFVRALRDWSTAHGALVVFDEVQSGFGRTGAFFAYQHFGVDADLVCCGKGMSSSLPISAVLGRRALVDVDPSLNSTHGGSPLCCAAALANLEILEEEGLVARATATGRVLGAALQDIGNQHPDHVATVQGRGLIWALHLVNPATGELDVALADMVTERAMRKGVLMVRTGVGTLKIGPPLCIPEEVAVEGARALGEALAESIRDSEARRV